MRIIYFRTCHFRLRHFRLLHIAPQQIIICQYPYTTHVRVSISVPVHAHAILNVDASGMVGQRPDKSKSL